MIEKSQVLSTVQQIKLRRLELEVEALRKQIQCQRDTRQKSLTEGNSDRLTSANTKTPSHSTPL